MTRIQTTFTTLKQQGRTALIPCVTAGFPHADNAPARIHSMLAAGASVIELGALFSNPSADGPVSR